MGFQDRDCVASVPLYRAALALFVLSASQIPEGDRELMTWMGLAGNVAVDPDVLIAVMDSTALTMEDIEAAAAPEPAPQRHSWKEATDRQLGREGYHFGDITRS